MPDQHTLTIAAQTDPGRVRSNNEDAVTYNQAQGFAVLADGLGGYQAGELASGMATLEIEEWLERELPRKTGTIGAVLEQAVIRANQAIMRAASREPRYQGMGTTIVAAVFDLADMRLWVAHVGDSRAYRLRAGVPQRLTRDHSVLQEQIDAGLISAEEARFAQNRNLLTRALGVDDPPEVEVHDHAIAPGDLLLLCSDGLFDMLSDAEIAAIASEGSGDPEAAVARLIDQANQRGGRDNISVILVRVGSGFS